MSDAFVKIDLHGLRQEEAMKVIDEAISSAGPMTYPRTWRKRTRSTSQSDSTRNISLQPV